MSKIELPIRSYIESFVRRAFPERDFSRGSGINDLVVKAFAVLMQPMRHEIDLIKVNQSLTNYLYMRNGDLDALAANWGKFRQTGARIEGTVRLYFNEAADYNLSFLEFADDAGSIYQLTAPVTIATQDLVANRRVDSSFYFDVLVRSNGIGDRYVVPAGSIRTVRGGPTSLFSCENVEDFQVSAPNESNYDVVNSMYRNIGMRNLVSRSSIRAPLLDQFSNLLDLSIAGSDHGKMYRDRITVDVDGSPVEIHLGGTVDVWCNTNSVSQRSVVISYLPSTGRINIVSADQAANGELAYTFSRGLITPEGLFISPDDVDTVPLDESFSVIIDQEGVPSTMMITAAAVGNRWPLAIKDLTGGDGLIALQPRGYSTGSRCIYVLDPLGPNLNRTSITVGDVISTSAYGRRRITAKTGRVLELSPVEDTANSSYNSTSVVTAGSRFVPMTLDPDVSVNDRARINNGAAAGLYNVLSIDSSGIFLGNVLSTGTVEVNEDLGSGSYIWRLHGDVNVPSSTQISGHSIDEVIVNVNYTEIYFPTGYDISTLVLVGDSIVLSGVDAGVNGTYPIVDIDTSGSRHFVTIAGARVDVASPAPGTVDVLRAGTFYAPGLPPTADTNSWVYIGTDVAHDQSPELWARITEIVRGEDYVDLRVTGPALSGPTPGLIVHGLNGTLERADVITLERDKVSSFNGGSRFNYTSPTLYCNVVLETFTAGSSVMSAIGIGEQVVPGDLITFTGITGVTGEALTRTGGDGTKVTAFIDHVVSVDQVVLAASFPFDIPIDTPYTVTRNTTAAAGVTIDTVNAPEKRVTLAAFQRGMGDGVGMAIRHVKPLESPPDTPLVFTISYIVDRDGHAKITFTGSPNLSQLYLSDIFRIDSGDSDYDGSYRIISVHPTDFYIVIAADFPGDIGPVAYDSYVDRAYVNQIVTSTAGAIRTLTFTPPKSVFTITMDSALYSACTTTDIGRTVEQTVGNITYRGTLYAFDNAARQWEIQPSTISFDLFTDDVTSLGSLGGFTSCQPLGGISKIIFPGSVDLSSIVVGDRITITGSTGIDGIYFVSYVSAANFEIRVSGNLASVAGPGPHGTCVAARVYFVNVLGSGAKGFPATSGIDTNGGIGFSRGYTTPATPADIGKIVRQGSYVGILDSFSLTPGVYTWYVKPISDSDIFDDLTAKVYIANSPFSPIDGDPQGTLMVKASLPAMDLSTVTFTLSNTPTMAESSSVVILPRFSRCGALFDGTTVRFDSAAEVPINLAGVTVGDIVTIPTGEGLGAYKIQENFYATLGTLVLDSAPSPDLVRIANAPAPQTLSVPSGGLNLTSAPAIVVPGSGIGVWGGSGRVLVIVGGGRTYLLPLVAPASNDSVQPAYGLGVTLSAGTRWTWEIVEGFTSDIFINAEASVTSYRIYRPPTDIGTSLLSRLTGRTNFGSPSFIDSSADFRALIGGAKLDGDVLLYIDSGTSANVEPFVVGSVVSPTEITVVSAVFQASEPNIQYRLVYRPRLTDHEGWFTATITSNSSIQLHLPPNTDITRNNTISDAVILVEPHPYGSGVSPWRCPRITGRYDIESGVITVDTADTTTGYGTDPTESDVWVSNSGFDTSRIFDLVRVHIRVIDRNSVKSAAGSVINTYNYYANRQFFSIPIVRIQAVELLDIETLAPLRSLAYTFNIRDKGLRYSADEVNAIDISSAEFETALFQPVRISYVADSSIRDINTYLNNPDTRVLGQSTMAKRMETITVDMSLTVRSEKSSSSISVAVASYINSLRSTRRLTKVEVVKFLFDQALISYVELDTIVMNITYLPSDGPPIVVPNVSEYFGSDISCYLSGVITILKITTGA